MIDLTELYVLIQVLMILTFILFSVTGSQERQNLCTQSVMKFIIDPAVICFAFETPQFDCQ